MKAYKLVRKKGNKLYPLFINRSQELELGTWLKAEEHATKGFIVRVGWHCCSQPVAPHLKKELSCGEKRVWVECEITNYSAIERPSSQGGLWYIAKFIKLNKILG